MNTCKLCKGKGFIDVGLKNERVIPCPDCKGIGEIDTQN